MCEINVWKSRIILFWTSNFCITVSWRLCKIVSLVRLMQLFREHQWWVNNYGWINILQIHSWSFWVTNTPIEVHFLKSDPWTYEYFKSSIYSFCYFQVFLWLKQWDFSVFGSELKTTTDDVLSALKRHTTVSQQKKVSNRNSSGWNKDFKSNSGTFKEHNHFDKENYNSHGDQQLHNKSKETGPPEQKVTFGTSLILFLDLMKIFPLRWIVFLSPTLLIMLVFCFKRHLWCMLSPFKFHRAGRHVMFNILITSICYRLMPVMTGLPQPLKPRFLTWFRWTLSLLIQGQSVW